MSWLHRFISPEKHLFTALIVYCGVLVHVIVCARQNVLLGQVFFDSTVEIKDFHGGVGEDSRTLYVRGRHRRRPANNRAPEPYADPSGHDSAVRADYRRCPYLQGIGFILAGAWPVLPFVGLEMLMVSVVLHRLFRHADDHDRIIVSRRQL